MNYSALWLDQHHATLFIFNKAEGKLDLSNVKTESIVADEPINHHNRHPHDVINDVKEQALVGFFNKITKKIDRVNPLLVMGPGIAKSQFIHHCESLDNKDISEAIVGHETLGSHVSYDEILARAESFFNSYSS
jgi:stalled ribosome rescue protein Dom34